MLHGFSPRAVLISAMEFSVFALAVLSPLLPWGQAGEWEGTELPAGPHSTGAIGPALVISES